MSINDYFSTDLKSVPFSNEDEYTRLIFACADYMLTSCLSQIKIKLSNDNGGYKNPIYPDVEVAFSGSLERLDNFKTAFDGVASGNSTVPNDDDDVFAGLQDLIGDSNSSAESSLDIGEDLFSDFASEFGSKEEDVFSATNIDIETILDYIESRADITDDPAINLRLYKLCKRLGLSKFSAFCLYLSLLSCTQTYYANTFQIINQSPSMSFPTIESAARIYFGTAFNMNSAFSEMSMALEQLAPILSLNANENFPFSAVLIADKRVIDYFFSNNPLRLDPQYSRFCAFITSADELDPMLANKDVLDSLTISYNNSVRVFSLFGDEGAGKRFTINHFCKERSLTAISVDAGKLFNYDYKFVQKTLWGVSRECIFSNSVCCLHSLSYREEEKEKFYGYMDLSFSSLREQSQSIFVLSELKLPLREFCTYEFTQLEIPTPDNSQREVIWKHYAKPYVLSENVDLSEMSTKFLFTSGKIKNALHQGQSLSQMKKFIGIDRGCLFEACYNQMKHELTQKATKVKATYTWDDIVMPPDQRQTLEYVCDQMKYRKQVYEGWNYNRKYPYGRGLSVLLFGHPGTGKTMCAQVLANALNLELYRVDLSKVIDKYVGETEKSISMIFREAKKCNVVLFFDEADTMFGKRTDSGGSGEQSANNKTAHLLQEIEAYDGVSVLATNFKHNIDPAFFRRMKFIVEFAFPDPETRHRIWSATIPKETPLNEDVDLRFLANRFEFVGGNIKNCILNAAFLAAADGDGSEMCMRHLLQAIKFELIKTGKVFTKTDFEPYANLMI